MYRDLQSFVEALDRAGELVRVRERVPVELVISCAGDLMSKERVGEGGLPSQAARRVDPMHFDRGGKAVLFEDVEGCDFPALINAWGSYKRMEMALGCEAGGFESIAERIGSLVKPEPPRGLGEAIAKGREFLPLLKIGPKRKRGRGACQEVVLEGDSIDLRRLPIMTCWPHDGDFAGMGYPSGLNDSVAGIDPAEAARGRYVTLSGIHTIHADDAGDPKPRSHNIGMYRVQLLGKDRVAMHWHVHHDGASHWRSWKKKGQDMPVAIVLGGESVLPYGATAPLPPGISELLMSGFLNGRGIEMCRGVTVPLWVPANAEIVIEGYVSHEAPPPGWDPRETDEPLGDGAVFEGPFGDHTGFYSMPDRYPVVRVTAVTHRRKAIYPTTVVGLPLQEDYFLGKATERVFLPLLKTIVHDIEDYDLPVFGAFHNCAAIKITKAYPMQGRRVMHSIWGAGQMAWTKCVMVVADNADVHDPRSVFEAMGRWCDPGRDVELAGGPLDILDHAAPRFGAGTKLGFDCTPTWENEGVGGVSVERGGVRQFEACAEADRGRLLEAVHAIEGVVGASIPDELAGHWLLVRADRGGPVPGGGGEGMAGSGEPGIGRDVLRDIEHAYAHLGRLDGDVSWPRFVCVVGTDVSLDDVWGAMFHWLANMDTGRDVRRWRVGEGGEGYGVIGFDSTPKARGEFSRDGGGDEGEPVRAWPPVLSMPAGVEAEVRGLLGL